MISIKTCRIFASLSVFVFAAPLFMGCVVDNEEPLDEDTGEAGQALTCVNAACNGISPYATGCYADQVLKQSVSFSGPNGPLGSIKLYYSPTCHTAWAYTALTDDHEVFYTIIEDFFTEQEFGSYIGGPQTYSQTSPMRFVAVGASVAARASVDAGFDIYGSSTPAFTRTY
jgi:Protein of unknown function (DUF2690)